MFFFLSITRIVTTNEIKTMKLLKYANKQGEALLAVQIVFVLFVLSYTKEELWEVILMTFIYIHFIKHLSFFCLMIDLIHIIVFVYVFCAGYV